MNVSNAPYSLICGDERHSGSQIIGSSVDKVHLSRRPIDQLKQVLNLRGKGLQFLVHHSVQSHDQSTSAASSPGSLVPMSHRPVPFASLLNTACSRNACLNGRAGVPNITVPGLCPSFVIFFPLTTPDCPPSITPGPTSTWS